MILKQKDPADQQLEALELALQGQIPEAERVSLEKRRAWLRAGVAGEKEAAYHVDFHLKDSPKWIVIHDLRLEWNGRVAQIDHLLIDCFLEVYVVESKSYKTKIRYANGGWERLNQNQWQGIPCPVEQNRRHILVLKEVIEDRQLAPKRLGITMTPAFFNVVLVDPSCSIIGQFPTDVRISRMDKLVTEIRRQEPSGFSMLKMISPERLTLFGNRLLAYHKPLDLPPRLTGPHREPPKAPSEPRTPIPASSCSGCGGPMTSAEIQFCRSNEARFGGGLLCRKCQRYSPQSQLQPELKRGAWCAGCGSEVDTKVVAYCRFNSRKFDGRILCRTCQKNPAPA